MKNISNICLSLWNKFLHDVNVLYDEMLTIIDRKIIEIELSVFEFCPFFMYIFHGNILICFCVCFHFFLGEAQNQERDFHSSPDFYRVEIVLLILFMLLSFISFLFFHTDTNQTSI